MKTIALSIFVIGAVLAICGMGIAAEEKRDLTAALAGTERYMYWRDGGKKGERVIRFTKDGKMRYQSKTRRWDEDNFIEEKAYKVMGPLRIQFGVDQYSIEFDEELEKFSGTCAQHPDRTVRGSHRGVWSD